MVALTAEQHGPHAFPAFRLCDDMLTRGLHVAQVSVEGALLVVDRAAADHCCVSGHRSRSSESEAPSPAAERQRSRVSVRRAPGIPRRPEDGAYPRRSVSPSDTGQERALSPDPLGQETLSSVEAPWTSHGAWSARISELTPPPKRRFWRRSGSREPTSSDLLIPRRRIRNRATPRDSGSPRLAFVGGAKAARCATRPSATSAAAITTGQLGHIADLLPWRSATLDQPEPGHVGDWSLE
jgi:hypothetical protein